MDDGEPLHRPGEGHVQQPEAVGEIGEARRLDHDRGIELETLGGGRLQHRDRLVERDRGPGVGDLDTCVRQFDQDGIDQCGRGDDADGRPVAGQIVDEGPTVATIDDDSTR